MADYTNSKPGLGDVFPDGGKDTSWKRTEPLLTPAQLTTRHLFGIPLISGTKDPVTKTAMRMTPDILSDYIDRAVSSAEIETGLTIFPTAYEAKLPYSKPDYEAFGFFRIDQRPIASIEKLSINLSSNDDLFEVPLEWIETANLHRGQINIIPLTIAITSGGSTAHPTTAGGATMLQLLGNRPWIAAFFKISATLGFPDGNVPKVVNDLIGTIAAMEVLSMLASTYRTTSGSLSIDSMSQSASGPGPEVFTRRLTDLADKRKMLIGKLKTYYGLKLFSGSA